MNLRADIYTKSMVVTEITIKDGGMGLSPKISDHPKTSSWSLISDTAPKFQDEVYSQYRYGRWQTMQVGRPLLYTWSSLTTRRRDVWKLEDLDFICRNFALIVELLVNYLLNR